MPITDGAFRSTVLTKAISDDNNAEQISSEPDFVIEHNDDFKTEKYLGLPTTSNGKTIIPGFASDEQNSDSLMDFGELTAANFKSFVLKNQRAAESLEDYMDIKFTKAVNISMEKIYINAYLSHLSKSEHVHAMTSFILADFINVTVKLSNGASPFHKIKWESSQGKERAEELERLFDEQKFAMLHSSRIPNVVLAKDTVRSDEKVKAIKSSQALMNALIHQLK